MEVDVVVIGAGVVGLACAERLSSGGRSVVVLEQHESFGRETSSRNSEVIHAGIYYPAGSLKAELCVEGARELYAWCERREVAHRAIGKYIVATCADEELALAEIHAKAHANGAVDVTPIDMATLRRDEPHVRAIAALWSPRTGIVDSHAFMASLERSASAHDCVFAYKHRVFGAALKGGRHVLVARGPTGDDERISAGAVVNAAGLRADDVATLVGIDVDLAGYRQTYVKGNYFRISRPGAVSHLVYPIPPAGLVGLGLHVTLDLSGSARIGPDVEVLSGREPTYSVPETRRRTFFQAASRYLSGLREDDLVPDQSGIRPKLGIPGGPPRDFVIAEESPRGLPRWINLLGIESPGLTSSLAIARRVAELIPK